MVPHINKMRKRQPLVCNIAVAPKMWHHNHERSQFTWCVHLNSSIASKMMFGARKLAPEFPLVHETVIVFVPLTSVPAGIAKLYTSPNPRYAPRVNPRESILVGAAGTGAFQELTTTAGRQPAKESVVPTRSVEPALPLNLMVSGFIPLTRAMGTLSSLLDPTV
jgi:hypothetical protein